MATQPLWPTAGSAQLGSGRCGQKNFDSSPSHPLITGNNMNKTLWKALAAAGIVTGLSLGSAAHAVTLEDLEKKLLQQAAEMQSLKSELATLKAEQGKQATQAPALEQQADSMYRNGAKANESQTIVSSYGEIAYTRPTKHARDAEVDVGRAVIGITHRFDSKTKMVAEFEWEHAVTSADDRGEAAVEQLYVEHELDHGLRAKAGLFLIPAGFINPNHEPTAYYGVQRNFVETAIIPTTWREAGLGLSGTTANSLTWDLGLTTGFDLTKWDTASEDGRESPLGSIHQEGQFAKARNLDLHGALNWQGVPGLLLGGSAFSGKAGHRTPGFENAKVTLFDLHARYQVGKLDLSALYAKGKISDTENTNAILLENPDITVNPTLIPASFNGAYVQAAYKVWKSQDYALTPFVRYERFNTAKRYSASALAAGAVVAPDEQVSTLGASLMIGEGVVLKADYQKFKQDNTKDRLNLGVGYSF